MANHHQYLVKKLFGYFFRNGKNSPRFEAEKDKRQGLLAYHFIKEVELCQADRDDKGCESRSRQKKAPIRFQSLQLQ